jgi:tetratricopeptide (TPR) repeat protein
VTTPSSSMLTEAIAAARTGDRSRARELLSRLLRSESSNPEYWIWMSAVVESKREKIYCLESALRLDPTNRAVMRGLVILGARVPEDAELATAVKVPTRKIDFLPTGLEVEHGRNIPWRKLGTRSIGLIAIVAVIGLVILLAPLVRSLLGTRGYRPASTLPAPSPTQTDTPKPGTPTATPIPAATRAMRTAVPTEFAATPLEYLVPRTSTPTPLLAVTPHPFEAYQSGLNALKDGNYEMAVTFMDQVIKADPELPDVHYFKGEALRHMDEIAEAIRAYERALNIDSNFAPAYLGRGQILIQIDLTQALKDFNSALRIDPTFTGVYLELASHYASEDLWVKLESTMQTAIDLGLTTPMLYLRLSEAQLNNGDSQSALESALEGSANDPSLLEGYLAIGRAYVAVSINQLDESFFASAKWPLQTYVVYEPEDQRALAALGRAHIGLGEFEAAAEILNRALEVSDTYAPAYLARGILHTELGEYELAEQDLTSARRYSAPSYDYYLAMSRVKHILNKFDQALENINSAISEANEENKISVRERKLAEGYALRALIYETNPDLINDAILNWEWVLQMQNVRPETRTLAENHLQELSGKASTLTPSSSPESTTTPVTPTPTRTPTRTATASPSPTP